MNVPDTLAALKVPTEGLVPYGNNPRRGNTEVIAESLSKHGQYRPIVVRAGTNEVLAGNHTLFAARDLGWAEIAATFIDVSDEEAARIVLVDNRAADLGSYDDEVLLDLLTGLSVTEDALIGTGFDAADLLALTEGVPDGDDEPGPGEHAPPPEYTRKMDSVQYEPTGECPPAEALVQSAKTDALLADIYQADVPEDVREFLIAGAQRHLVFNYAKIAEFYAHAEPEVQALMEASALVIIDFEDAAKHGFVRLSSRLAEIREADLAARAAEDAKTGRANVNAR